MKISVHLLRSPWTTMFLINNMGLMLSISTLWNFKFGKLRLLWNEKLFNWHSLLAILTMSRNLTFSLKSRQILSYHILKVWLILPFYFFAHYFTYFSIVSGKTKVQKFVNSSIKIGHCKNHQRGLEKCQNCKHFWSKWYITPVTKENCWTHTFYCKSFILVGFWPVSEVQ